ncbi:hypothetical protein [Streptomyces syringium]|uniref:Uncharacterized protein n=1 Tax=Streptomyces syringium TaxID=76729 RepID=A0ABS4XYE0_9ACTN|nr:hypothetical protein [Streptomyces syringium]MBP2400723.1 hypothetical protein [Streptomyces syringium]
MAAFDDTGYALGARISYYRNLDHDAKPAAFRPSTAPHWTSGA